ncbi:MAG: hypothetical protein KatS3mg108_1951 [Isosphaeraceae bacterium]|nr:MAG: hypothetical protein KatS3mg108_1951 [Isosphaeraceae bacterium]
MASQRLRRAGIRLARGLGMAWLMLGVALGLLLLLECLLRVGLMVKDALVVLPDPDPRVVAEGYDGASWVPLLFREQAAVQSTWHPYVTHRARPFTGQLIRVEGDGLRRTVPAAGTPDGAPVVWLAGGSVAWGMGARDQATIASRMAARLASRGRPARVINRAQIGYVQTQELADILLALRAGERPDAIVLLDGVNEVLSAYQNGTAGWPQNEANRIAEFNLRDDPARLVPALLRAAARHSALGRLARSLRLRLAGGLSVGPAYSAPWSPERAEQVAAICAANLQMMADLADRIGCSVIVAWQPLLFSKRTMTDYEHAKAVEYAWLREPLDQSYEQLRRLSSPSQRLRILDLSRLLDDVPSLVFTDFCHLTERGQDQIAAALTDALAAQWPEIEDHSAQASARRPIRGDRSQPAEE